MAKSRKRPVKKNRRSTQPRKKAPANQSGNPARLAHVASPQLGAETSSRAAGRDQLDTAAPLARPADDVDSQPGTVSSAAEAVGDGTPTAHQAVAAEVVESGCAGTAEAETQGLSATYWFDAADAAGTDGRPYSLAIRFAGVRTVSDGHRQERFERVETVHAISPAAGRVAVTTRVNRIAQGEWRVTATPLASPANGEATGRSGRRSRRDLPVQVMTAKTRLAPLVHGPGVRPFVWPALVGLGVLVGILIQALLIRQAHADVTTVMAISAFASLMGFLTAKTWYLVLHHQTLKNFASAGTYIQGFLLGTFATAAVALLATDTSVGLFLDTATPSLFLAMAIGRPGCFFSGCCVGRPTTSRWGLWSSDRRVGIRRFPTQLMEALLALVIGITTLALALAIEPPIRGTTFAAAVAAYTFGRQVLFPLRSEPRRTSVGRLLTVAASVVVFVASIAVTALA